MQSSYKALRLMSQLVYQAESLTSSNTVNVQTKSSNCVLSVFFIGPGTAMSSQRRMQRIILKLCGRRKVTSTGTVLCFSEVVTCSRHIKKKLDFLSKASPRLSSEFMQLFCLLFCHAGTCCTANQPRCCLRSICGRTMTRYQRISKWSGSPS